MAFVIFWAAMFAVVFFFLEIFFRLLISVLDAFAEAIEKIGFISVIVGISLLLLSLLFDIITSLLNGDTGEAVSTGIMFLITFIIFGAMIVGLGKILSEFFIPVLSLIFDMFTGIAEKLAYGCNLAYKKFQKIILNSLNKC